MIAEGAEPVTGTVVDGTVTPDPGDPTALADPSTVEFDPGYDPGYEDEEELLPFKEPVLDINDQKRIDILVGMGGAVTNLTAVSLSLRMYDPDAIQ